jgi:hypothetical protein
VPSAVLQTAVAAAGNDTALTAITWHDDSKYSFTTLEHYADFQNTQLRQFDSYSGTVYESYKPPYLTRGTLYTESFKAADGNYSITLVATNTSVLPPMINALEIYLRVPYENPTTLPSDCKYYSVYFQSNPDRKRALQMLVLGAPFVLTIYPS